MVWWVIVALVVGVALGAGAVLLFEDEPARVDAGAAEPLEDVEADEADEAVVAWEAGRGRTDLSG